MKEPLSEEELNKLASLGGISVVGLINPKSQGLKKLNVDLAKLSEQEAAALLTQNPKIMYRPLLTGDSSVTVGFKPELMEKIIREEGGEG